MSDAQSPNGRTDAPVPEGGILAALPRARPQRASPRRTAARGKADKPAALVSARKAGTTRAAAARTTRAKNTKPSPATGALVKADRDEALVKTDREGPRAPTRAPARAKGQAKTKRPKTARTPPTRKAELPPSTPAEPAAPKQGYEPEEELELGKTVNPPSGTELAESVADILGELASSGLSAGGRLLRDAFSVLRRP